MIKTLAQQIDEYKNDSRFTKLYRKSKWNSETNSWDIYNDSNWHWDDNWDGQLIKDVQALEQAGFTIVSFSRKRKVTLNADNIHDAYEMIDDKLVLVDKRTHIVYLIVQSVGDSWYSISFKPTLSIYWKGRSSKWNY